MSSDPPTAKQPTSPLKPSTQSTSSHSLFLTLPSEIHTLIATHLPYPDLLSLTLTHPIFTTHAHIRTDKSHRVDWLISRADNNLPLPTQSRCRWSSDREFVSNPEVTAILRRRREHVECAEVWSKGCGGANGGGCLVVEGKKCVGVRGAKHEYRKKGWIGRATGGFGSLRRRREEVRGSTVVGGFELLRSWAVVLGVVVVAWVVFLVV